MDKGERIDIDKVKAIKISMDCIFMQGKFEICEPSLST
jgi:hypothetical protein